MVKNMFIKGLIHGVGINILAALLGLFFSFVTQDSDLIEIVVPIVLAIPFLYVGYEFRKIIKGSLIEYLVFHNQNLWYYPIGAALITATISTLLVISNKNTHELGFFVTVTIFAMSILAHAAKIGAMVYIGFMLNRKRYTEPT